MAFRLILGLSSRSREKNNPRQSIGGLLYFENNIFFQCLEGNKDDVNRIYNKITKDPRHYDIQIISAKTLPQRKFTNWSMKYVVDNSDVAALLDSYGQNTFNPYAFSDEMIDKMLDICVLRDDPTSSPGDAPAADKERSKGFFVRLFSRKAA